jgi:hypothetical protein
MMALALIAALATWAALTGELLVIAPVLILFVCCIGGAIDKPKSRRKAAR